MLNQLAEKIYEHNVRQGFYDGPFNVGEKLMFITSELSEALEADRRSENFDNFSEEQKTIVKNIVEKSSKENFKVHFEANIKNTFEDELADAIIRILDLCAYKKVDINWHIEQKMKYNKTRSFKHGKKY